LFASERHNAIYQYLETHGSVSTKELEELFGVSLETIRRDLMTMEAGGMLQRVHGGAIRAGGLRPFLDLKTRLQSNNEGKRELCRNAMDLICEGDILAVDSGSTAITFAECLRDTFHSLTVITHSLDVFNLLRQKEGFRLILCAGHYFAKENAFYGPLCMEAISRLQAQKAFIFPSAVSMHHGLFDNWEELLPQQQAYIHQSENVFVLADSSKFECRQLLKIDDMSEAFTYVTDSGLSEALKETYQKNRFRVITGREKAKGKGKD